MPEPAAEQRYGRVALLAEGVDRNSMFGCSLRISSTSPSSRRAWIEIIFWYAALFSAYVALLAEGVDRNFFAV